MMMPLTSMRNDSSAVLSVAVADPDTLILVLVADHCVPSVAVDFFRGSDRWEGWQFGNRDPLGLGRIYAQSAQ